MNSANPPSHAVTNPYRQPKPSDRETIATDKFHRATPKGTHIEQQYVYPRLCKDYLWVGEELSIPLASILETGLSKRGGWITFWDSVANAPSTFSFTKVGFLRYRRADVEKFLHLIEGQRPTGSEHDRSVAIAPPEIKACERCGA